MSKTLNLKDLVAGGAFVSTAEPYVKTTVQWVNEDGEDFEADVWVRRESYHTVTVTWREAAERGDHLAARMAAVICDENGAAIFSIDDILGTETKGPMIASLFLALLNATNEVNTAKKNPRKTSGSN